MKYTILAAAALLSACSHSSSSLGPGANESQRAPVSIDTPKEATAQRERFTQREKIAVPRHPLEARALLKRAFVATEENRIADALPLFEAILQTDLLSDEGLANLYWTVADQRFRLGLIDGHFDALGQYLVAESLVDRTTPDPRVVVARSVLTARKVATRPRFGRSKERPIEIVDARELPSIVSALPCGEDGSGRFIEVRQARVDDEARAKTLVHHHGQCDASEDTIDLWFDVTHMR